MYYAFFGLKQPPFRITPDTDFFFEGGNRGAVLEALIYAVTRGEGIVKVTGEVGSGKTMLCRVLQQRLPASVETVYLANPSVSPDEILHAIAFELQLPIARDASRLVVMHALNEYLLARHAEGRQVVVFVEESQGMPIATLEEIRLLSNLETRQDKLLQIVLFGQPELDANLRKSEIRQLRERITHSFSLAPLSPDEVRDYLAFRLRAAGYHGPDLFSPRVIQYLAAATGGLTRRINIVADKALLAAFAENTHNVTLKHVQAAVRDSEFSGGLSRPAWLARPGWTVAAGLAVLALVAGVLVQRLFLAAGNDGPGAHSGPFAPIHPAPPPGPGGAAETGRSTANPSATPTAGAPAGAGLAVGSGNGARDAVRTAASASAQSVTANADSRSSADAGKTGSAGTANRPSDPLAQSGGNAAHTGPAVGSPLSSADAPRSATAQPGEIESAPDLLAQRLLATERWLAEEHAAVFSIQLLGSTDPELLRGYLKTLSNYIDPDRIFVYRTVANREPSMTVLYGAFPGRAEALESLDRLPAELKLNRPYIRTVQGIRSELGLNKPS